MFSNFFSDCCWTTLPPIGSKWELVSFTDRTKAPEWDDFRQDQRKYWGADDIDKGRFHLYFGADDPEKRLLESTKKAFREFSEHILLWNGLCREKELVEVIHLSPSSVIALSRDWKGQLSDHSDLEIWLKEEKTFFRRHVRYCCEIYSFGTLATSKNDMHQILGGRAGLHRVSHRVSLGGSYNPTIAMPNHDTIIVGDATFRIVDRK